MISALALLSGRVHLRCCLRSFQSTPNLASSIISGAKTMSGRYGIIERGSVYTSDYKLYITGPNGPLSAFHDIPLHADSSSKEFNMIVEIPRWTNAKMEISKEQRLNPIVQDVKKGALRFVDNVFPFHGYIWNYGALPQTWEDPGHMDERTGAKGDNDPLDVCEIGSKVHPRGSVIRVKPLGLLGLIDEGETDWKILVIDAEDPLASQLNGLADIEAAMPGFLDATRRWFRVYKMPQGKPANEFAFNGEFRDRDFALGVIEETHKQWQAMMQGASGDAHGIARDNVSVVGSSSGIDQPAADAAVSAAPAAAPANDKPESRVPDSVGKWHFV
ncbi:hypothetical protein BOX15_Mlig034445g1 [Macrostomum lignano]|uniref:Uncharacterized protein n=2 Tax=Macrostomum lignano TaxID=282301 RepID=A0A267H2J8_9PLAT|nr:hypothetical protein BOX15_Mlig034445g1 [Macrostomum lignano]